MNLSAAVSSRAATEMPQIFEKQNHALVFPSKPSLSKLTVKKMLRRGSVLSKPSQPNLHIYTLERVEKQFRPIPVGSGNCSVSRTDLAFVK